MREQFSGYYRPTEKEFEDLWSSGLVVPDTNVLLTLYRLSEGTRQKLLDLLARLQERLFVPYQVAKEFQDRRVDVIEEQIQTYESVEELIEGFAASVGKGMRQHPRLSRGDLEQRITTALQPVNDHLAEVRAGHPDPLEGGDTLGTDVVRDALGTLFAGRIGEQRDLEDLCKEGRKRYERKQPPGWTDADKPEPARYGDLAIWLDVLEKAEAMSKPVILVTEERKEDWWWKRKGKLIGPRPELVEELRERSGQRLCLYNVGRFMEEASKALSIELSEDERGDVARARAAVGWPGTALDRGSPWQPPSREIRWYGDDPVHVTSTMGRWVSSVECEGMDARLQVNWDPPAAAEAEPESLFLCVVTAPDGTVFQASRANTALAASVRYPDDFADRSPARAGRYAYTWYRYFAPPTTEALPIASGHFELGG
jgi:hypothetical protein